ncbi:hypothetical protein VP242E401_P0049 [Vibrio phage 242E40-1]|nr:hypothetical protein VP242E401_P0049 [Vibrio phage 242E40-1]
MSIAPLLFICSGLHLTANTPLDKSLRPFSK